MNKSRNASRIVTQAILIMAGKGINNVRRDVHPIKKRKILKTPMISKSLPYRPLPIATFRWQTMLLCAWEACLSLLDLKMLPHSSRNMTFIKNQSRLGAIRTTPKLARPPSYSKTSRNANELSERSKAKTLHTDGSSSIKLLCLTISNSIKRKLVFNEMRLSYIYIFESFK